MTLLWQLQWAPKVPDGPLDTTDKGAQNREGRKVCLCHKAEFWERGEWKSVASASHLFSFIFWWRPQRRTPSSRQSKQDVFPKHLSWPTPEELSQDPWCYPSHYGVVKSPEQVVVSASCKPWSADAGVLLLIAGPCYVSTILQAGGQADPEKITTFKCDPCPGTI